jgi:hypothetical protein
MGGKVVIEGGYCGGGEGGVEHGGGCGEEVARFGV